METNQKSLLKRIILTTVLVVITIITIINLLQLVFLKKDVSNIEQQLMQINELLLQAEEKGIVNESVNAPDSLENVEQVSSSTVVIEPPKVEGAEEPQAAHKVYLTFDDGPSKQTDEILEILDQYNVKATFFVVGKEGEDAKERLKKIYESGHTIGMHSYSHDYANIYESEEAFREDFLKIKKYIYDAIGVESRFFRFPGGSSNTLSKIDMAELAEFLAEQNVEYYDWNISSGDGGGNLMPARQIVKNCIESISRYGTSIILLHDSGSKTTTVEALPQILEEILAMEDTVILPLTDASKPIHHVIKKLETEDTNNDVETKEKEVPPNSSVDYEGQEEAQEALKEQEEREGLSEIEEEKEDDKKTEINVTEDSDVSEILEG